MNKSIIFLYTINIYTGHIVYNDFNIDEKKSFSEQRHSYKMDMLQIKFGEKYLLDVGWIPEFNPRGSFLVQVIQNYDWLNPIIEKKCQSLASLKKTIESISKLLSVEE